jgi:hypothetical protein
MEDVMSDANDPDAWLAARFACEHTHVPADRFVSETVRRIHSVRRRASGLRFVRRVVAVLVVVLVSPWLIAGVERLNAALESSARWTADQPVAWVIAGLAVSAVFGLRMLRSR